VKVTPRGCNRRGRGSTNKGLNMGQPKRYDLTCVMCGAEYVGTQAWQRYCSKPCKTLSERARILCRLPYSHPVRAEMRRQRQVRRGRRDPLLPPPVFTHACDWCGTTFTAARRTQLLCSDPCRNRIKESRRRAKLHNARGEFTWSEFTHVFIKFDRRCAYCETRIVGQPEPDHLVPLSKGGSNSITNILPACRPCNLSKQSMSLSEWAACRERRGRPPVTTSWAIDDPRVQHLTTLADAA
jgi:5-methylcytosine-specific restriction endonuclease McrA